MLAAYANTITLGALLISALAALAVVIGIFYGVRYKVSYEAASAAAEELRKSLADEKDRTAAEKAESAETIAALRKSLEAAQQTISRLESLPDMAQLVKLLDKHEVRAQERHEATTSVLRALTERLTTTTT